MARKIQPIKGPRIQDVSFSIWPAHGPLNNLHCFLTNIKQNQLNVKPIVMWYIYKKHLIIFKELDSTKPGGFIHFTHRRVVLITQKHFL